MQISMAINGERRCIDISPSDLLVDVLRDRLGLRGTHVGCDTSQCGACVVHFNGRSVKSCTMLAASAAGGAVTTIEGMAGTDGQLHPVQRALRENHGLQCGFCTPGVVMSLADLLQQVPMPDEKEVRVWLGGNLCRCTGYQNIVAAALAAAAEIRSRARPASRSAMDDTGVHAGPDFEGRGA